MLSLLEDCVLIDFELEDDEEFELGDNEEFEREDDEEFELGDDEEELELAVLLEDVERSSNVDSEDALDVENSSNVDCDENVSLMLDVEFLFLVEELLFEDAVETSLLELLELED